MLLNAVVHRDYKCASDIVIKIFDDHIVFTSPGKLFGNLTIEDLKRDDYISSIRNKLLAEAFYLMGDIEKYGTGFVRIRKWLKAYPELNCHIGEIGDFFRIEIVQTTSADLKNDLIDLKIDLKRRYGLNDTQSEILKAVHQNRFITQQELANRIGITPKNIRINMSRLKSKGLLSRVGPPKGGFWQVLISEGKPK